MGKGILCLHQFTEIIFLHYYKPWHPRRAAGYFWATDSYGHFVDSLTSRPLGLLGILGTWVSQFFLLSWWVWGRVSLLGLWAGWALDVTPGSCWTLESVAAGRAFQGYHFSTLLILHRTKPKPRGQMVCLEPTGVTVKRLEFHLS